MLTKLINAFLLQLLSALPMFFVTYWSWMILAMLTDSLILSVSLAFLMNAVFVTIMLNSIGVVLGLRGRITMTLIGACIGAVLGGMLFIPFLYHWLVIVFPSLPTLAAALAYQWSADRVSLAPIE